MTARRFPPPWIVEELDACFVVTDGAGQKLAYVYFEDEPRRRSAAKLVVVPNHVPPPNDCDGANGNQGGDVIQ
jgi:hypothetical protein